LWDNRPDSLMMAVLRVDIDQMENIHIC